MSPPDDRAPIRPDASPGIEITTERLHLRPFRCGDLEALVAYRSDPDVARYQSWDASYGMPDAEAFLAAQRGAVFGRPGEWLQLAMADRTTGTVHGDCAVRVVLDPPATAEVGVTLAPASQGRGLATEGLAALVTVLFDRLRMERVLAEVDDRNVASRRLFERLGFGCESRLVDAEWFKGAWATLRVYAIGAADWRRSDRPPGA